MMVATGLVAIDSTILATAVPSIVDDLGGFSQFPWLFSIYLLAQAITVPIYSKLADMVGRKPIMLVGIALFLLGSILCGFAWSMPALIQSSWLGMIFLVSFLVILANVLILLAIDRAKSLDRIENDQRRVFRWTKQCYVLSLLCFGLVVFSLLRYLQPESGTQLRVAAIQPGVDMAFGDPRTEFARLGVAIQPLVDRATEAGAQLIVLPEGVGSARTMPPDLPFTMANVPVIFGAQRGTGPTFQSAFGFDGTFHSVDKTRLVVFGEFVPGREYLPFIADAFSLPSGDMIPGPRGTEAMKLGGNVIGPVICFEGLFPDIAYRQAKNGAHTAAARA